MDSLSATGTFGSTVAAGEEVVRAASFAVRGVTVLALTVAFTFALVAIGFTLAATALSSLLLLLGVVRSRSEELL